MNKLKGWIIISILIVGITDLAIVLFPKYSRKQPVNIVELSRFAKAAAENINNPQQITEENCSFDYVILDESNHVICRNSTYLVSSLQEAVQKKEVYYPITKDNKLLGYVVAKDPSGESKQVIHQFVITMILLSWGLEICFLAALYRIDRKMIHPFHKMEIFAQDVAMGNLDRPLDMDHKNLFGAFTESFDIMREELKKARTLEAKANESKKELVASLSHDIKTPVTAIKLISDILLVKLDDDVLKNKVKTIYKKADQIDLLITDLFHATLEELGELSVDLTDIESSRITEMIDSADYNNCVTDCVQIPECMIHADPLRLQQVITNIISNSYKYANTGITTASFIEERYLVIEFRDYGPGIPADEIHLVFEKFYRSKEEYVQQKQGAGLGLYISKFLMEKMAGGITCYNEQPGLVLKLSICLS